MRSLEALCGALSAEMIPAEVWINGSFLTHKIDPADVDLAVRLNYGALPSPTATQQALLHRIVRKQFGSCDSYVFFEYPINHPQYPIGDMMHAYWQTQFGFSRAKTMKGIAVVETPV